MRSRIQRSKACCNKSAHKLHIWGKHYLDIETPVRLRNFISTHEEFVDPEYVLKDGVTLLIVTATTAIFVEFDRKKRQPYCPDYGHFMGGQFDTAAKVIVLPLTSFVQLAEKMSPGPANLLFVHNHGRCGSTLLLNMFWHTGRVVTLAEPRALESVCLLSGQAWPKDESRKMIRCVIRMLTKPYGGLELPTAAYVIKPSLAGFAFADIFEQMYPESKSLFLYRDPHSTVILLRMVVARLPASALFYLLASIFPSLITSMIRTVGYADRGYAYKYSPQSGHQLKFLYHVIKIMFCN